MKIISVKIGPMPKGLFDPMPAVVATFEDGTTAKLFEYYPDEISFTEAEFVGLNVEEARRLRHKKDVAYIQAP